MNKVKFLIFSLSLIFFHLTSAFPSLAADKIVAIVNNEIVTQNDLDDFRNFIRMQLSKENKGEELEKKLSVMDKDMLNRLIEDRLILQEAKKSNLVLDENRVKARVSEIKRQYASEADFQSDLARQGLVEADIAAKIKEQLLMFYVIEFKVRAKIKVRPEEVTNFYNSNSKDFFAQEEREVEVAALDNEDLASSFSYELKSGASLVDLAARYPLTINKMKFRRRHEIVPEAEEVVYKLALNEISNPVKVDQKYYVFKVENIIPPRQLSLSEVQDEIYSFLMEKKSQEELANWIAEIRSRSYIKIMQDA